MLSQTEANNSFTFSLSGNFRTDRPMSSIVIGAYKIDFAAVDSATVVDHSVIGRDRVTGRAK